MQDAFSPTTQSITCPTGRQTHVYLAMKPSKAAGCCGANSLGVDSKSNVNVLMAARGRRLLLSRSNHKLDLVFAKRFASHRIERLNAEETKTGDARLSQNIWRLHAGPEQQMAARAALDSRLSRSFFIRRTPLERVTLHLCGRLSHSIAVVQRITLRSFASW